MMKIIVYQLKKQTPVEVLVDTKNKYSAIYEDRIGKYPFIIKKTKKGYSVESSGVKIPKEMTKSKERLQWEFESQLANVTPKIFQ